MSTHTAHFGFSFTALRGALHWPHQPSRPVAPPASRSAAQAGWMERLAAWSDRHPPTHHRMGSYTRLR